MYCSFLIASSVFSNVYLSGSLDCTFLIASSVFSSVYLSGSLDCTFLIASSVFSNVYLSGSLENTEEAIKNGQHNWQHSKTKKTKQKDTTTHKLIQQSTFNNVGLGDIFTNLIGFIDVKYVV
jgi:hypothetical protein